MPETDAGEAGIPSSEVASALSAEQIALVQERIGELSIDEVRQRVFYVGPWNDPALDVPKAEALEYLEPQFRRSVDALTAKRAQQGWLPAELLLTPDGGSQKKEMGGLWRADPEDPTSKFVWRSGEIGENGLFIPQLEELVEEGRNLTPVQTSALFIDGLTEDNLPNYARLFAEVLVADEAGTEVLRMWLTDEDLHKLGFDSYMHFTQVLNPYLLEKQRSKLIREGEMPDNGDIFSIFSYVSLQEPATKISHRNTPKDGMTMGVMLGHIAGHEKDHGEMFLEIGQELMKQYPSQMILAMNKQMHNFAMPGSGIENFDQHAAVMSFAGIFDVVDTYNIMADVADELGIFDYDGELHPEAEVAREQMSQLLLVLQTKAHEAEESRDGWRTGEGKAAQRSIAKHGDDLRRLSDPFNPRGAPKIPVKVSRKKKIHDLPFAA